MAEDPANVQGEGVPALLGAEPMLLPAREWKRRIFVNRDLRMDHIRTIGFDMDFTLAIYREQAIQELTFTLTLARLIEKRGYPASLSDLSYEAAKVIRGLLVDKRQGNLLKLNRFNHCMRAFHGSTQLEREARHNLYTETKIKLGGDDFHFLDSLFCLPEGALFLGLIDRLEPGNGTLDYKKVYGDVRAEMDAVHADNGFKHHLGLNVERFIERDPLLPVALHRFRSAGKQLFILTNSRWEYTDRVMRYLLEGYLEPYQSWLDYFDHVTVFARKPQFFREQKPPSVPELDAGERAARPDIERKVLEGGNIHDFEQRLALRGDTVLYVGDHIYGDMLRSKKDSLWRTAMIIPELDQEIETSLALEGQLEDLDELAETRRELDHTVNYHRAIVKSLERLEKKRPEDPAVKSAMARALERLRTHRNQLNDVIRREAELDGRVDHKFHPMWGSLFRDGHEKSRFWNQVETYACLYTSRVSNFCYYSPVRYFRPPRGLMPHEPIPIARSRFT